MAMTDRVEANIHPNKSRVCARCWWFDKVTNTKGLCTQKPPVPVVMTGEDGEQEIVAAWPPVDGGDWCSRWHDKGVDPGWGKRR